MKLNTDNINYEPKNWIESEKRFEPFVFNKVKNDELLNFKVLPHHEK